MVLIAVLDWVSVLVFSVATALSASTRVRRRIGSGASLALASSMLVYALASLSNALEHSSVTGFFDPVEDIVEVLFIMLFLFFVYTYRADKMMAQLRERAERLRVTLESIGDGIVVTDKRGHITQLNHVMETMSGHDRSEVLGLPAHEILVFHDRRSGERLDLDPVGQVITHGQTITMPEAMVLRRRNGGDLLVADSAAPILADGGEVLGVVMVLRDITEQESLAEQLRQTQKMEAIGQLAGGVAHDFNNMLGGILGAAEMLAMDLAPEHENRSLVDMIIETTDRAADLTRKLLAFGRKRSVISTPVDIHAIVDDALALLERTVDKRIVLVKDYQTDEAMVVGDLVQLQNAVLNLAINARDAMPDGGTLTVTTKTVDLDDTWCANSPFDLEPGAYVVVSVQDTGSGMSHDIQQRIFEPFFTTKGEGQGTGLGLAAVYGTVVSHHGACSVYSEVGHGTVFHLYFPVAPVTARRVEVVAEALPQGSGCILVIDDEAMIRATADMILSQHGYEVLLAEDGEEGLDLYRQHGDRIKVVLLDMVMPKMSGNEVYRELRQIDAAAQVILSSGFSQGQRLDDGVAGFISKPYRRQELLRTIAEVIG